MKSDFITYQKFDDIALANALAQTLEDNSIPYETEEESAVFDPSFALNNAKVEYAVKIKSDDFDKVNRLLNENAEKEIDGVEADYYLFDFTDAELLEVIEKADEWNAFDVALARKILGDRGKPVSDAELTQIHEHRVDELKEPEPPQTFWVTLGYIIALINIILPFFISVIGFFIGWHLWSHKKTLPNGERVFGYRESDRRHGKRIFYLSIILFSLNVTALIVYRTYFYTE